MQLCVFEEIKNQLGRSNQAQLLARVSSEPFFCNWVCLAEAGDSVDSDSLQAIHCCFMLL